MIKKAVVLAQLSLVRSGLGQGSRLRCLLQVTLLCQCHLSFDFWSMLFHVCALVTPPFSLAAKLVFQLLWNLFRLNSSSMNCMVWEAISRKNRSETAWWPLQSSGQHPAAAAATPAHPNPCLPCPSASPPAGAKEVVKSALAMLVSYSYFSWLSGFPAGSQVCVE